VGKESFSGRRVFDEKYQVGRLLDDAPDRPIAGENSYFCQLQKIEYATRWFPKEVDKVGPEVFEVVAGCASGQSAIHVHALAIGGDVTAWDIAGDVELEVGGNSPRLGPALAATHSSSEQLAVEFVADRIDVAALFGAEDVAGAANFEIPHGDAKPRAEL